MNRIRLAGCIAALTVVLPGCSTQQIARFETKAGSARCTKDHGLVEGTKPHQQCVAGYLAAAEEERANTQAGMLGALGVATQVWAAEQQGRANAAASPGSPVTYQLQSDTLQNWQHICRYANGTVINSGSERCPPSIAGR
jgi:hypothetical protein